MGRPYVTFVQSLVAICPSVQEISRSQFGRTHAHTDGQTHRRTDRQPENITPLVAIATERTKNRAQTSCSPGPILSPPCISFEIHAKTAEEIDPEKCTFRNFGSSVTLTLDRVEVTLVRICGAPRTKLGRNRKTFRGRTDGRTDRPDFQSTRSSPGDDLTRAQQLLRWASVWPQ